MNVKQAVNEAGARLTLLTPEHLGTEIPRLIRGLGIYDKYQICQSSEGRYYRLQVPGKLAVNYSGDGFFVRGDGDHVAILYRSGRGEPVWFQGFAGGLAVVNRQTAEHLYLALRSLLNLESP